MDDKAMIQAIAADKSWALETPEEGVYLLSMPTTGDRSQSVYVVFKEDGDHHVALIWSHVGSASKFEDAWQLLDYNWSHTYGALARRNGNEVVLKHAEIVDEGHQAALGKAIEHVGKTADSIEKELYGELDLN